MFNGFFVAMIWDNWKFRWQKTLSACSKIGGEARELKIGKTATEVEVLTVENKLGFPLPKDFRQVLTDFSSSIDFSWFLPEIELPTEFREIFSGECSWNLNDLIEFITERHSFCPLENY